DVRPARPDLLAVDDPLVALEDGAGLRGTHVGAAAGLGEALAPDLLSGQQRREITRLLLVGAPRDDRGAGHAETDPADMCGRSGAGRLLEEDALVGVGRAAAAVLLGPGQADVAGVVQLPAPGTAVRLVPPVDR